MGGLAKLINDLAAATGLNLPPWAGPAFLLGCVVLFWPLLKKNVKTGDARKLLVKASRERGAERERLEAEALAMVGDNPDGLAVVAQEALEQGRRDLAQKAVDKLRATGKNLTRLRQFERQLEPPLPATPAEACIVIERLIATGMTAEARTRFAQARRKWPFDDELEALEPRLAAGSAAG